MIFNSLMIFNSSNTDCVYLTDIKDTSGFGAIYFLDQPSPTLIYWAAIPIILASPTGWRLCGLTFLEVVRLGKASLDRLDKVIAIN